MHVGSLRSEGRISQILQVPTMIESFSSLVASAQGPLLTVPGASPTWQLAASAQ